MKRINKIVGVLSIGILCLSSCERDFDSLEPAGAPVDGNVYIDGFSPGLNYAAFGGSVPTAFDVDQEVKYSGTSSMKIAVPDANDPKGAYAGGTYFTSTGRDLSGFNVLTFWAKASKSATIDVIGFGNDLDQNRYVTTINGLKLNTNWEKVIIPIPDPSKLINERGMFFYSEGPEDGNGYTFWIDEVKFEKLGTVTPAVGRIMGGQPVVIQAETGNRYQVESQVAANLPNGIDQIVNASPAYFEYTSSDPAVATVSTTGEVTVMDAGTARITATLGGLMALGELVIESSGEAVRPMNPAPSPTVDDSRVISIYSNAYNNVPVDFYNGFWEFSTTQSQEIQVNNDDIIRYSQLNFVGIQFTSPTIDATSMKRFHIDIWTPDQIDANSVFRILLFDVGPDGTFQGSDNSSHEITIPAAQLRSNEWLSIDLSLQDFPGLTSRMNLAQVVLSGTLPNVFVDNIYLYDDGSNTGNTMPTEAAPIPTEPASNVISVFSDSYTNLAGTDFNPNWGQATQVSQLPISGNNTLVYRNLNYQGTQFAMPIDARDMDFLHIDYWTSNSSVLNVFTISTGPMETAFAMSVPTSGWASVDIPLTSFTGVDLGDIIQFKFDGNGTIYLDNIYFFKDSGVGPTEPVNAPTAPSFATSDVISLFSDEYADVPVDTWRTEWSVAELTDLEIAGNAVKRYSNLDFVGVEAVANPIDVNEMTHFYVDIWSADFEFFAVKLVDFGADGSFGGGDDVEHQVEYSMPAKAQWVNYDIPLSAFTGLTTKSNVAQIIFVGRPTGSNTIFVDNVLFHK